MLTYRCLLGSVKALGLIAVFGLSVAAQEESQPRVDYQRSTETRTGRGSIRGRVVMPGGAFVGENVKVSLLTLRGTEATIYTDGQGWFEFPALVPGNYEVQIETAGVEYEVVNQPVQVFRGAPSIITVSLRPKSAETKRAASPSISVGEFGADVPKNARKEFQLASKAAQDNKSDEAIQHLRNAISIYPNFVMARSDLGAQLLAQGKLEEASEELRAAIRIDDKAFNPRLNLGIVLVGQHEFAEAAETLNRALSLNSDSPAARLYSGMAQMGLGNLDEAEKHFKAAYTLGGSSYSVALFHLGQVYMNKGERDQALHAFESYLHASPAAANADQVRKLIAMLR